MVVKHYKFGRYTLRTHLYSDSFWKIAFLADAKFDKYTGQRWHSQVTILGYHFSVDFYISDRDRLKVI